MYPVSGVKHLEPHVREELLRDRDVVSVEVPTLLALDEQRGAPPLWRGGTNGRWWSVREVAYGGDGGSKKVERDAEGQVAVGVDSRVGEEKLACRQELRQSAG
jgi:hypothetical protein